MSRITRRSIRLSENAEYMPSKNYKVLKIEVNKINAEDVLKEVDNEPNINKETMKGIDDKETENKEIEVVNNTRDIGSTSEDDPMEGPVGYNQQFKEEPRFLSLEEQRSRNVQENAAFLCSLGIEKVVIQPTKKANLGRGLKRKSIKPEPIERRPQSLRLQNKDPEGVDVDKPAPSYVPFSTIEDKERPQGSIAFDKGIINHDDDKKGINSFHKTLQHIGKQAPSKKTKQESLSTSKYLSDIKSMKLTEAGIAKVTKSRAFSVAVHPSEDVLLAACGGKWGGIGLWQVDAVNSPEHGVYLYEPHSRPVNCLKFAPKDAGKLYSASYDGSVRLGTFEKGVFDDVYVIPNEEERCTFLDFLSDQELIVSQSDGKVAIVDTRTPSTNAEQVYQLHGRRIKSVSVHPLQKQYFLTASQDSNVCLWDMRKLDKKPTNIVTLSHGKSVDSAYFSPITGKYFLTTSIDDHLRVFNSETLDQNIRTKFKIKHNNHTGRWLTNFRATWHPAREDVFIVGSMAHPRQIELFSSETSHIVHTFNGELLASVCSCNSFHPTKNILIGANSSGRLHVFK